MLNQEDTFQQNVQLEKKSLVSMKYSHKNMTNQNIKNQGLYSQQFIFILINELAEKLVLHCSRPEVLARDNTLAN